MLIGAVGQVLLLTQITHTDRRPPVLPAVSHLRGFLSPNSHARVSSEEDNGHIGCLRGQIQAMQAVLLISHSLVSVLWVPGTPAGAPRLRPQPRFHGARITLPGRRNSEPGDARRGTFRGRVHVEDDGSSVGLHSLFSPVVACADLHCL